MDRSKIYEVYGSDPGVMTRALLEAVRPEQEIPPGGLVVLKPNLAVSKPAESGATTHPGIVGETIRYLREKGIDRMVILESSWIGDQTREAFRVCGYETVAQFYGVPLVDVKKDAYETKTVNGISMQISRMPRWSLLRDFLTIRCILKSILRSQGISSFRLWRISMEMSSIWENATVPFRDATRRCWRNLRPLLFLKNCGSGWEIRRSVRRRL